MARLRYMSNARIDEAGTVCNGDLTVTGALDITGALTYGTLGTISLNQNLQGTLTVGQNETGYDVLFYGDGDTIQWLWDQDADGVVMTGTTSHTGAFTMEGTSKLHFTNSTDGEYIYASADNALAIHSGSTITLTATTIAIAGAMTANGKLVITPISAATGSYIDIILDDWVSGVLINVDTAATTFTNDVIGMLLDFTNVTAATNGKDIRGYQVKFPACTPGTDTEFIGFDLPTVGAIDTSGNDFDWKGVNLQLPAIDANAGNTSSYGVFITGGAYTGGSEWGVYIDGTRTGIELVDSTVAGITISGGSQVIGINMTGAYSTGAIKIGAPDASAIELAAVADYNIASYTACDATTGEQKHNIFQGIMDGIGALGCGTYVGLEIVNVRAGAWVNAFYAKLDFKTSGTVTGLASAACFEMVMPGSGISAQGTFAVIEAEMNCSSSWSGTNPVAYFYTGTFGSTVANFDDYGLLFYITGLTDDTTHLHFDNTLKMRVGTTTWYLPMSSAEASYTTAYPIVSTYSAGTAIDITTTTATTGLQTFVLDSTFTANSGTHFAMKVDMTIDATTGTQFTGDAGQFIATLDGGITGVCWVSGLHAGLTFEDEADYDSSSGIYVALNALVSADSGAVISSGHIAVLRLATNSGVDLTGGSGICTFIYIDNDQQHAVGGMDSVMCLHSWDTPYLFDIPAGGQSGGIQDTTASSAGTPVGHLKIRFNGSDCYINVFGAVT